MMALRRTLRELWRRLSRLDLIALAVVFLGTAAALSRKTGVMLSFLKFLALLAGSYLVLRLMAWGRTRLLWRLRNRLMVAYLFIAVVPVLLLVILAARSAQILYSQLAAYLLMQDVERRIFLVSDIAQHIVAAQAARLPGVSNEAFEALLAAEAHAVHDRELPGLSIGFTSDATLLGKLAPGKELFAGLLQQGEKLWITDMRVVPGYRTPRFVELKVEVTPWFLATLAPDLGAIQFNLMRRIEDGTRNGVVYSTGGRDYEVTNRIVAQNRALQPATSWIDTPVTVDVVSRFDSSFIGNEGQVDPLRPVLAVFNARPSRLNAPIFASLGELKETYLIAFILVVIVFVVIEIAAFVTGVILTRQITKAINDLYLATQFVQAGDWAYRVRVERRDQLGALATSFNKMTASIGSLMQEQAQRQRLESEISIAREVQEHLLPRKLPTVPGVELAGVWRAARSVSGDYYDFIQLGPTQLALAIGDISGKGISAALLMASLQAALRSQTLVDGGGEATNVAKLVGRLNALLTRNTSDDRFATFFIAVYDSATRHLRYTNAGHLPALLISKDSAVHLGKGGMVLGVLEDCSFEEDTVVVPPDSLLIAYSDGLVEPENVYGEEFGIRRLEEAATRVQSAAPRTVADSLMKTVEEWSGTPEQADDMTVLVARFE